MSFGSEFQTFGAATQNARLAVSVRVHDTERRGASVDRRDRVVTWRSSLMYGGTEVDRTLRDDRYFVLDHVGQLAASED